MYLPTPPLSTTNRGPHVQVFHCKGQVTTVRVIVTDQGVRGCIKFQRGKLPHSIGRINGFICPHSVILHSVFQMTVCPVQITDTGSCRNYQELIDVYHPVSPELSTVSVVQSRAVTGDTRERISTAFTIRYKDDRCNSPISGQMSESEKSEYRHSCLLEELKTKSLKIPITPSHFLDSRGCCRILIRIIFLINYPGLSAEPVNIDIMCRLITLVK